MPRCWRARSMRSSRRSSIEMSTRLAGMPEEYIRIYERPYLTGFARAPDEGRQQRRAGNDAGQLQPLVDGVIVAADRPQPIQRGDPERGRGVRVRSPSGRRVAQPEAQLAGDADR